MADVTPIRTPAEQGLIAAYDGARGKLPGKGAVASLREDAFKRFDAKGLPTRRVEEWKYTDLRTGLREALPLAAVPDAAAKANARDAGAVFAALKPRKLTFVDGAFVPELSDLSSEAGLSIGSMAEALTKGDAEVTAKLGKTFETDDIAVALNTALMGDGVVIRIAAGTALKRPLHLVFVTQSEASSFTRSLIVVEKGAKVAIAESHEGVAAQVNTALELIVGDEAEVDYYKVVANRGVHLGSLLMSAGRNARFDTFVLNHDVGIVRNQSFIRFAGEHSKGAVRGVNLLRGEEHVDNTLLIEHVAAHCAGREQFKAVLDGESHSVFQGKIVVKPGAQKTDSKMMTRALLLSDKAEADNKPELEIFADDVVCGHGATAGALDPTLKFYLMSRGIDEAQAEALLIQAFIGETVEEIANEGFRDAIMNAALAWLEAREVKP
ncbi:Fe-S cluster assembly protein SufD [Pseudolabrys sp. FHR47]|uniref:Fe-S cluster assembly protein SufD n=1 Tax=Pseudolabrys sp. FHR47 TaxID=2562284 RepID=UPI0010BE93C8|nr:Fe-S cluster assembly protein SufD [Pseudolabrys sp. FHR47]